MTDKPITRFKYHQLVVLRWRVAWMHHFAGWHDWSFTLAVYPRKSPMLTYMFMLGHFPEK